MRDIKSEEIQSSPKKYNLDENSLREVSKQFYLYLVSHYLELNLFQQKQNTTRLKKRMLQWIVMVRVMVRVMALV